MQEELPTTMRVTGGDPHPAIPMVVENQSQLAMAASLRDLDG
jgi:hypothetical protein